MGKDPAFLFYPNDYIGGTMGMTFEEKGAYMELLMMQFNRGHMSAHMIGQEIGQIWNNIKQKFIQDNKGLWYNERLEMEIKRRKAYTESRKNNIKGINQYTKKENEKQGHMDGHLTSHMENENININKEDNSKKIPPKIEDVKSYCKERNNNVDPNKWFDFYTSKGWMVGKNKMKDWKAAVRTWEDKKNNRPQLKKL